MAKIVNEAIDIGPVFVGDQLPPVYCILSWDTGGYVDLTSYPHASWIVKRYPNGRSTIQSGSDTDGGVTFGILAQGQLTVNWAVAFTDPGWYSLRITLTDGASKKLTVQRMIFEVQAP